MSYKVSEKRKIREKRGTGHFEEYKPWINPREIHGLSTTTDLYDPRVGRPISLLSQKEKYAYLCLSWDDDCIEIREQFPLNSDDTTAICSYYGIMHPHDPKGLLHFTSDFLVDYRNGSQIVYSVKPDNSFLEDKRTCEKLFVEKKYWEIRDVEFRMVVADTDINIPYACNIGRVLKYYPISEVHSRKDMIMHLIAHKNLVVDLSKPIMLNELANFFLPTETIYEQILNERRKYYAQSD